MTTRFRIDPATGDIGIYTLKPGDPDAPLTSPLSNLSYVYFHPALRYVGAVATLSGTLSLPAGPGGTPRYTQYTLGAHGQSGRPMLIGKLNGIGPGGADVAWTGSIPVQRGTLAPTADSSTRWLTLGCNATNVIAYEICRGTSSNLPSMSVSFTVLIIDRNLDGTLPNSGGTSFRVDAANGLVEFQTPKGSFSTAKRYPKAVGSGGWVLPGGITIHQSLYGTVGSSILNASAWSFSHGSGNLQSYADVYNTPSTLPAPGFASPSRQRINI
jgi:hypothetical protein